MKVEAYVVLLFKLVGGVQSIQSPDSPVSPQRAALYARAAAYHGQKRSVDPFDLLAVARNESDFNEKAIGPDGLDCGLTQTRVTYSRYRCEQLQRSHWLAFAEAARELSAYANSCAGKEDFDRCRFNRYNSGTRYARRGWPGRYYLRVGCYAEAARRQLPLAPLCRDIQSEEELAGLIARAESDRDRLRSPRDEALIASTSLAPSSRDRAALDSRAAHEPLWAAPPDTLRELALGGEEPLWITPRGRSRSVARRQRRRRADRSPS